MCDCRHRRVARLPSPTPPRLPWPRTSVLDCQRPRSVYCLRPLWPRTSVFDCHSNELSLETLYPRNAFLRGIHLSTILTRLRHGNFARPPALMRRIGSLSSDRRVPPRALRLELALGGSTRVVPVECGVAQWRSILIMRCPILSYRATTPFTTGATWVSWRLCFISFANAAVSAAYQLRR